MPGSVLFDRPGAPEVLQRRQMAALSPRPDEVEYGAIGIGIDPVLHLRLDGR